VRGEFIMMDSIRVFITEVTLAGAVLAVVVWMLVRYIRDRRIVASLEMESGAALRAN
jgi:hypothetical protein